MTSMAKDFEGTTEIESVEARMHGEEHIDGWDRPVRDAVRPVDDCTHLAGNVLGKERKLLGEEVHQQLS